VANKPPTLVTTTTSMRGRGTSNGGREERSFDTFSLDLPPFIHSLEVFLVDDAIFALGDFVYVWAVGIPPLDL